MANELTVSASLAFAKTTYAVDMAKTGFQCTVTGTKFVHNVQAIGFAAEEAIQLGDVGTPGYAIFVNRDATNYVTIRPATGVADCIKLKPGDVAMFRFACAAPFAIAAVAACNIEYVIIED